MSEAIRLTGVIRFGKQGKLNPWYIRPFNILERIGPVAYQLELPEELSNVHSEDPFERWGATLSIEKIAQSEKVFILNSSLAIPKRDSRTLKLASTKAELITRLGLAEVKAWLAGDVFLGVLAVKVENVMGGSSPTLGLGIGVSVEKPDGGDSSLSVVMPKK
uniref:Putative reverse transcriptase domain-containing protein n=1 Tax=Tanacetum cinerariifolium TaxID=118510 RepID=A0A6L2M8L9_TANCI|nr:putative reverse transcriptase domain-containing protein [Tanacetum cinerariifolium]